MYNLNLFLRMTKARLPFLNEGLDPLLGVLVLEVLRHHLPALLVGRVERELQLPLVELLAERDHSAGLAGDGLAHLVELLLPPAELLQLDSDAEPLQHAEL